MNFDLNVWDNTYYEQTMIIKREKRRERKKWTKKKSDEQYNMEDMWKWIMKKRDSGKIKKENKKRGEMQKKLTWFKWQICCQKFVNISENVKQPWLKTAATAADNLSLIKKTIYAHHITS